MRMRTGVAVAMLVGCAAPNQETARPLVEEAPKTSEQMTVSTERRDAIERVFARKAQELQSCWAEEYEKTHDRKLEGDLTLGMRIEPSGQAGAIKVLESTLKSPNIESCVVRAISAWTFPDGQAAVPYMRTVHLGAQF